MLEFKEMGGDVMVAGVAEEVETVIVVELGPGKSGIVRNV